MWMMDGGCGSCVMWCMGWVCLGNFGSFVCMKILVWVGVIGNGNPADPRVGFLWCVFSGFWFCSLVCFCW